MLTRKRISTHPGEVLQYEFLDTLEISQAELARHLGVTNQRINELVKGKRGITPETAWLLAKVFNTTPEFWMNLQTNHDLTSVESPKGIKKLVA